MKKLFAVLTLALAMSFFVMPMTQAATIKTGENVVVPDKIMDDAYVFAGNGNIDADVVGDLYIAGGKITINGNVGQDLVVAGGRVTVMGDVLGDIRLLGGQVSIYGKVGEDVLAAAGEVEIGKKAFVNGDLFVSSGMLTLDGQVKGNLKGFVDAVILNGVVGRDVSLKTDGKMEVSPTAQVYGNLEYSARNESKLPDGVIKGAVKFTQIEKEGMLGKFGYWFVIEKLFSLISSLLLLLVFVLFSPKMLVMAAENIHDSSLKAFGFGLLTIIGMVIAGGLLMVSVVGIPFALIVCAGLLVTFLVSQVFVASWLGRYFYDYKKAGKAKLFGIMALAMFAYHLVSVIPYVGWAINFVLFLAGVGSMVMLKFSYLKFLRSKKMI